jgi:hypothetical protein
LTKNVPHVKAFDSSSPTFSLPQQYAQEERDAPPTTLEASSIWIGKKAHEASFLSSRFLGPLTSAFSVALPCADEAFTEITRITEDTQKPLRANSIGLMSPQMDETDFLTLAWHCFGVIRNYNDSKVSGEITRKAGAVTLGYPSSVGEKSCSTAVAYTNASGEYTEESTTENLASDSPDWSYGEAVARASSDDSSGGSMESTPDHDDLDWNGEERRGVSYDSDSEPANDAFREDEALDKRETILPESQNADDEWAVKNVLELSTLYDDTSDIHSEVLHKTLNDTLDSTDPTNETSEDVSISDESKQAVGDAVAKFKLHADRLGMDERDLFQLFLMIQE